MRLFAPRVFRPHAFAPRVEPIKMPRDIGRDLCVVVSGLALSKMHHYVDIVPQEVGWLGICARPNRQEIVIEDVLLFEQDVSHARTSIRDESIAAISHQILQEPDGFERLNRLRFWGHSHGHSGVWPSPQDDETMLEFQQPGVDYFVRGICNRRGEMCFDVYLYDDNVRIMDVPWMVAPQVDQGLYERIAEEVRTKVHRNNWWRVYENEPTEDRTPAETALRMHRQLTPDQLDMIGRDGC